MGQYQSMRVCELCNIAFSKDIDKCPKCGIKIHDVAFKNENSEGEGRRYGAGGDACNYCPHCNGTKNWCPYMD